MEHKFEKQEICKTRLAVWSGGIICSVGDSMTCLSFPKLTTPLSNSHGPPSQRSNDFLRAHTFLGIPQRFHLHPRCKTDDCRRTIFLSTATPTISLKSNTELETEPRTQHLILVKQVISVYAFHKSLPSSA